MKIHFCKCFDSFKNNHGMMFYYITALYNNCSLRSNKIICFMNGVGMAKQDSNTEYTMTKLYILIFYLASIIYVIQLKD